MLNNVYLADQQPNFRLGARPQVPRWVAGAQTEETDQHERHEMDTDEYQVPKARPVSERVLQQLIGEVRSLSEQ